MMLNSASQARIRPYSQSVGGLRRSLMRADHRKIHPDLHVALVMVSALPVCIGLVLLFGSAPRFSSSVWEMQRLVAPWWVWGSVFCLGGALLLFEVMRGNMDRVRVLLLGCSMIFISQALGLLGSALKNPDAAFTGCIVYSWTALMQLHVRSLLPKRGKR